MYDFCFDEYKVPGSMAPSGVPYVGFSSTGSGYSNTMSNIKYGVQTGMLNHAQARLLTGDAIGHLSAEVVNNAFALKRLC